MALPVPVSSNDNQEIDTTPIAEAMGTALAVFEPNRAMNQNSMANASPVIEGEWEVIGEDINDGIREGLDGEFIPALEAHGDKVVDITEAYMDKVDTGLERLISVNEEQLEQLGHIGNTNAGLLMAVREQGLNQQQTADAVVESAANNDEDSNNFQRIADNTQAQADAVREGSEDVNPALGGNEEEPAQPSAGQEASDAIKDNKKTLGGIGTLLAVAAGVLKGLVIGATNYLRMIGSGIARVFGKLIPQRIKGFGTSIMQGIKSFGANIINSIKNFGKAISATFKGSVIGKNIMKGITRVKDFFGRIGAFFTRIGKFFQPIFSLFDAITGTTGRIAGIFSRIGNFVKGFMTVAGKVANVVSKAFAPLMVAVAIFKGITASFDKFAEGDFLGGIGAFLDGIFQFLVIDLLDILYDVVMFIPKLIMRALGLDDMADMFDDFSFSGLWDGFKNGFMDFFVVTLPNMLDGVLSKIGIPSFGFGPIKAFGKTIVPRFDFDGYYPFKEGAEARIQTRNDAKAERDEKKTQEAQAAAEKAEADNTKIAEVENANASSGATQTDAESVSPKTVPVKLDSETANALGLPQEFQLTGKDGRGSRTLIADDGTTIRIGAKAPMAPILDKIYEGTTAQQEDATAGSPPASADATAQQKDIESSPQSGEGIGNITGDVNDTNTLNKNNVNIVTSMNPINSSTNVNNVKNSTGIIYDGGGSSLGGRSALLPN